MASIDPYSPCPCGSGNKFKWCCHKIESFADKSLRLFENGQVEASLSVLDEGLAREPGNAWLLIRKAWILTEDKREMEALSLLEELVRKNPAHVAAQVFMVRLTLQVRGLKAGIDQFQQALNFVSPENRHQLLSTAELIAMVLGKVGLLPTARAHLRVALDLGLGEDSSSLEEGLEDRLGSASVPLALRDDLKLKPASEGLSPEHRQRFEEAYAWANAGRWASAAASFDLLEGDGVAGADWNLGLCRFWLLDPSGAIEAWRRTCRRLGASPEAVDIEVMCQLVEPAQEREQVELVQLIWTLRDRETFVKRLESSDRVSFLGEELLDPDDPDGVTVEVAALLDRPKPTSGTSPDLENWPRVLGRALIGREIAILEAHDDGRLDSLSNWFTDLAGDSLPPAQPRTKKVDEEARSELAMRVDLLPLDDEPQEVANELVLAEKRRILTQIWPETPMPYLGGRTPRQAAAEGGWEVPLRAAMLRFEGAPEAPLISTTLAQLRADLGLPREPVIDPATADLDKVSAIRLEDLEVQGIDDDKLLKLHDRAQRLGISRLIESTSRALVERPELLDSSGIGRVKPYADLALLSLSTEGMEASLNWVERGRAADPLGKGANAVAWDMLEIRARAMFTPFESWVPSLAVAMERYGKDRNATTRLMTHLLDMGLVRAEPHPEDSTQIMLDTRILQSLLAEYGPRVTTADGAIGISAGQRVWTPETPPAGSTTAGGIWTPGSSQDRPEEGKSKLIIPGR